MCVAPQKSVWATSKFNIVDALAEVERRNGWKRQVYTETEQQEVGEEPKFLLRQPRMGISGPRLKEIVDALLLTHKQLCRMTGIHHSTMSRIVKGRHFPTKKNAEAITHAVNKLLAERGLSQVLQPGEIWPGITLMNRG